MRGFPVVDSLRKQQERFFPCWGQWFFLASLILQMLHQYLKLRWIVMVAVLAAVLAIVLVLVILVVLVGVVSHVVAIVIIHVDMVAILHVRVLAMVVLHNAGITVLVVVRGLAIKFVEKNVEVIAAYCVITHARELALQIVKIHVRQIVKSCVVLVAL